LQEALVSIKTELIPDIWSSALTSSPEQGFSHLLRYLCVHSCCHFNLW